MKKKLFYYLFAVLCTVALFTSCSDDDDNGKNGDDQIEVADISGIILTKMDGTAKGGIAVAIQSELGIPVKYIGVGERIDDLQKFNSEQFVTALFDRKDTSSEQ